MIASRPLGTMFQLVGTAATHVSTTRASAEAAQNSTRAPATARALAKRAADIVLADGDLGLHPRVDEAHEVQRGAGLRRHLEVDGLALLALPGDAGVSRAIDPRRRRLPGAVLQERELGRRVTVRVRSVRLAELL